MDRGGTILRWLAMVLISCILSLSWSPHALADSGYSAEELDTLVGPIALYPDPLLSTVVAAAAEPEQVRLASTSVKSGNTTPDENWNSSVQGLCAYPDVLSMMSENQEWTQAVGWAGVNQTNELMDAVQRFRFQAQTAGNLQTNDKMQVIEEGTTLRIEPANPEVIYVPTYQPQTVIVEDDNDDFAEVVGFGAAVATGALLWSNMYHWNSGSWYHPPYGWRPGVAHYGAYGWRGNGIYNRSNVYNPRTNINRPVNINNINTGNINIGNRPGAPGNRPGAPGNRPGAPGSRPGYGNRPMQPSTRPSVSQPGAWGGQQGLNGSRPSFPTQRPSFQGGSYQSQRGSYQSQRGSYQSQRGSYQSQRGSSGFSNYSRSGSTTRSSQRGSYSRGSSSYSSGGGRSRSGGGGRRR